jgi:hypothetical protein
MSGRAGLAPTDSLGEAKNWKLLKKVVGNKK